MNAQSMAVVALVHQWNKATGKIVCGYTFDAGPNAVLLCEKHDLATLMGLLDHYFEPPNGEEKESKEESPAAKSRSLPENYIRGASLLSTVGLTLDSIPKERLVSTDPALIDSIGLTQNPGALSYMILSKLGLGAKELPDQHAILEPVP